MKARVPAEVSPPGEFLKDELEARDWTQVEFSEIIGRDSRLINEVINGKRSITAETALIFSEALGTSPELWMNLESQYQLSKVRTRESSISKKAGLHSKFPVREMIKRGWVGAAVTTEILEMQLFDFFGIKGIDEAPVLHYAAKKQSYINAPISQLTWLFRVKKIAETMVAKPYSEVSLRNALPTLSALLLSPEGTRQVPKILADAGVRFLVVEHLPGSKIDGACLWLDAKSPVIGLTMRRDKIDNFWFVLRHEIEHILNRDGQKHACIDVELDATAAEGLPAEELLANEAAAEFCLPQKDLRSFIARVQPFFSEERVTLFARKLNIHVGIVVGQLQRQLKRYDLLVKHQAKVRHIVCAAAVTDGFGFSYPIES
ncbi:HigA family addiction module antitoxin [Glaciimonas immobilis]|uniref:HTH-type transcriptional regulator/antitoxin HigA n=1 Tax=Glaciimonas immobilis TaxID=728004 RepID=A0A840RVQ0_9BURK|nr:HigA family addiction module antitoxin [Glaciimonas immobilis]KAF3997648.1 HigA family addiction module antidote protein [Glaciimonas immobilis]MBB5200641.1 HTH-type transcriptional regulator/antitoxin HigA [Glaciimonas immobilis]